MVMGAAAFMLLIFKRKYKRAAGAAVPLAVKGEELQLQPDISLRRELLKTHCLPRGSIFSGSFQVFDKEGVDITQLFTPVLRELFLLIVIYTIRTGRGITAEELTEILWLDKAVKDARTTGPSISPS